MAELLVSFAVAKSSNGSMCLFTFTDLLFVCLFFTLVADFHESSQV